MSGGEAERGVRPETFLPPGLCFVPGAGAAARGPPPPEAGRCPPLGSVAPRVPTLSPITDAFSLCDSSLLFQMGPHPLLRAGLSADLDCPPLPWGLAKPNAQCRCGLFLCCWEAGQGRRAAGLPAGGAPQVPTLKSRPDLRVL